MLPFISGSPRWALVAALLSGVSQRASGQTYNIGLLMRKPEDTQWQRVLCAARLAQKHINDGVSSQALSIIPEIAAFKARGFTLNALVYDTHQTEIGGIAAYRSAVSNNVNTHLGPDSVYVPRKSEYERIRV